MDCTTSSAGKMDCTTSSTYNISSASMAEAIAMKECLILANRLGCNSIIAESNSIETIDACKGGEIWWTQSAAIYANCMDQVASIGNVSFVHCPREANKTAHKLARQCFIDKNSCNWDDEPPSFLQDSKKR
jgi:hypothetical protein